MGTIQEKAIENGKARECLAGLPFNVPEANDDRS